MSTEYDQECDLWDSASAKATAQGLEMTRYCPFALNCSGEICKWDNQKMLLPVAPTVLPDHIEAKLQELLDKPRK